MIYEQTTLIVVCMILTDNELLMMDYCTNHFIRSLDCYEERYNSFHNKKWWGRGFVGSLYQISTKVQS